MTNEKTIYNMGSHQFCYSNHLACDGLLLILTSVGVGCCLVDLSVIHEAIPEGLDKWHVLMKALAILLLTFGLLGT